LAEYGTESKRARYSKLSAELIRERTTFESHWRECAQFVRPQRYRTFTSDRNRGDRRNRHIIDSTATHALGTLASGMQTGMSNPASSWFELAVADPDLNKFPPVRQWLKQVTDILYSVFASTNLYTAFPSLYADEATFGTGCMAITEDTRDLFRCRVYPAGSYAFGVNDRGNVDTFVHEYQMTVGQIVETFIWDKKADKFDWSKTSRTVKNLWDQGSYETEVEVCWVVAPNREPDDNAVEAKYLPYYSCHFEKGKEDDGLLKESGFNEFPIVGPRWDVVFGDAYATSCPTMNALGDIIQLQTEARKKGQAIEKHINPPLQGPPNLKQISLLPGEYNATGFLGDRPSITPLHEIRLSIEELREDIADVRNLIHDAFYTKLFLMVASSPSPQKTAREIEELHEEKFWALSQVIERHNDELYEPAIDRTFAMAARANLFPPFPEELRGVRLSINYVSMLNRALKLVRIGPVDRFINTIVGASQVAPEVLDKVNWLEVVNEYADMTGVPPKLLRTDEEAMQRIQARQQQQADMMAAEQAKLKAGAAKDLGTTPMDQNTALATVMGGGR